MIFLMFLLATRLLLGDIFRSGNTEGWQKRDLPLKQKAGRGAQEQVGPLTQSIWEAEVEVPIVTKADCIGLGIMALLEVYNSVVHRHLLPDLEFLPLMLTSTVCAVGLLWVWLSLWMLCCFESRRCKDD